MNFHQNRAKKSVGKQLFLSIHHDSAQEQFVQKINGHSCSNKDQGFSIFVSAKNPYFDLSKEYAIVLGNVLVALGLEPSTHHGEKIKGENRTLLNAKAGVYQFDDLIVLKQSKCPAILLEAAVIIHPLDDERIKNVANRYLIATAIAQLFHYVQGEQNKKRPKTYGPK